MNGTRESDSNWIVKRIFLVFKAWRILSVFLSTLAKGKEELMEEADRKKKENYNHVKFSE